jgi:hypothetical protein
MAQDRRVELAALTVAAIVGLGAPFGTVLATNSHDSNRLHAEQAQSDRAELRKVLDDAATSLLVARVRFDDVLPDGFLIDPVIDRGALLKPLPDSTLQPLQEHLFDVARQYNRVAIRLGIRAPLAKQMRTAFDAASKAYGLLRKGRSSRAVGAHTQNEVRNAIADYVDQANRFIDIANRVARSTTG